MGVLGKKLVTCRHADMVVFWTSIISHRAALHSSGGIPRAAAVTEDQEVTDRVKVYALSTCPYCRRTKEFLKEHGIECDIVDVDLLKGKEQDDVLDEIERITGKQSFPVVLIGDEVIVGHNEEKLRKALGL